MQVGSERHPAVDVAFAVVVIGLAGVIWWGTAGLPPPRWEPIGSAALPRGLALVMGVLAVPILVGAVRRWRNLEPSAPTEPPAYRRHPARAVAVFAVLVAYVALLDLRTLGFAYATIPAFVLVGAILTGFDRRQLPRIALFVVALVLAIQWLFTRVFYVDLP